MSTADLFRIGIVVDGQQNERLLGEFQVRADLFDDFGVSEL